MNTQSLSLNKLFHIVIAITIIVIYLLLNWVTTTRTQDFIQHQNAVALKVATSTANEISTYIQNRRDILQLLQKTYKRELVELKKDPDNQIIRLHLHSRIALVFPEMIDFNIATHSGAIVLPKASDFKIGNICKQNISAFIQGHLEAILVHGNPNPVNYHFDILTNLYLPREDVGVLFASFNTTIIEAILRSALQLIIIFTSSMVANLGLSKYQLMAIKALLNAQKNYL